MKIEKGTKLIAIDPCDMEYEDGTFANENALIVGKEYTVLRIEANEQGGEMFAIESETDNNHYFEAAELKDFFTFPE